MKNWYENYKDEKIGTIEDCKVTEHDSKFINIDENGNIYWTDCCNGNVVELENIYIIKEKKKYTKEELKEIYKEMD